MSTRPPDNRPPTRRDGGGGPSGRTTGGGGGNSTSDGGSGPGMGCPFTAIHIPAAISRAIAVALLLRASP